MYLELKMWVAISLLKFAEIIFCFKLSAIIMRIKFFKKKKKRKFWDKGKKNEETLQSRHFSSKHN